MRRQPLNPTAPAPGRVLRRAAIVCGLALCTLWSSLAVAQRTATKPQLAIIPIEGEIDDIMLRSLERRITDAQADGVSTIAFEMSTPGGVVTSAIKICTLIKQLPDQGIRTIAWVRDDAYSAGAMISVACQQLVMGTRSKIGDCAPIMIDPTGGLEELPQAERAKVESPILEEFLDSATRFGYPWPLCRAMVAVGVEIWWVENTVTGERRFVDATQKAELFAEAASQPTTAPAAPAWRLVETYTDPLTGEPHPLEQPIDSPETLLTLSQSRAVALGFARQIVADANELAAFAGTNPAQLRSYHITGWETFARWLNSPLVRGVVFVIMLIGAYIEFHSPGLILPGATALIALAIFLGAPYAAGLADIWTIILLVVGLVLLGIEIFVIPGFGITGILGVLLIIVSFVGTFVPREPGMPPIYWPSLRGTWTAIQTGIIVLASSLIIAVTGIMLLIRFLPQMPGANRILLENPQLAGGTLEMPPEPEVALVGDVGIVVAPLRPGGLARFGQHVVDVTSQGEYVDSGTRVQVLERLGPRVVVRPLTDAR